MKVSQKQGKFKKRISRAVTLLLCICLLAAGISYYEAPVTVSADSKETQKKLDAVNDQIDDLKDQQAALDDQIDSYSNDLASVSAQAALLNDKVALLYDITSLPSLSDTQL